MRSRQTFLNFLAEVGGYDEVFLLVAGSGDDAKKTALGNCAVQMHAGILRALTHDLGLLYTFLHFLLVFGKGRMPKSDNFPPSVPSEGNPVAER